METTTPFNSRGVSWPAILKLVGYVLPFVIGAGMLYLGKEFATHNEIKAAVLPYEQLPAKVQSLDEFRLRQEKAQDRSDNKFEAVQTSIVTLAAQQAATNSKVDRVLDILDRMNRRSNGPNN